MSVESDLVSVLEPLAGSRVYPDVAPDNVARPYITYQQVGGTPVNFLSGVPSKRNGRFQINVWADTRIEAANIIRQVEDAVRLSSLLLAVTEGGAVADYEDEMKLYGARQDFSIWFQA